MLRHFTKRIVIFLNCWQIQPPVVAASGIAYQIRQNEFPSGLVVNVAPKERFSCSATVKTIQLQRFHTGNHLHVSICLFRIGDRRDIHNHKSFDSGRDRQCQFHCHLAPHGMAQQMTAADVQIIEQLQHILCH